MVDGGVSLPTRHVAIGPGAARILAYVRGYNESSGVCFKEFEVFARTLKTSPSR